MKSKSFVLPLVVGLALVIGCKKEEAPSGASNADSSKPSPASAKDPSAAAAPFGGGRKTTFQEVTTQLDAGGSLYLYLSTDQWLAGLSKKVSDLRSIIVARAPANQQTEIGGALNLVTSLIQKSGLEDVAGVGMSSAPVASGLYRNKLIVQHTEGAGQGYLWSTFGKQPHALDAQKLLPATTALAFYGDLDVVQLWTALSRDLSQSGVPQVAGFFQSFPQMFEQGTQISLAKLLASLGGEAGVILTLDPAQKAAIPMGGPGQPLEIPMPGLVIAVKVKDEYLYDQLSAKFKANPQAVSREADGLKICSMEMPNPFRLALQLTVASSGDYLFLASSPDLVSTVQAVRNGKQPGLKSSAEFQNLAKHLPAQGNQFAYVGANLGKLVATVQSRVMSQGGLVPGDLSALQNLFGTREPSSSLSVGAHTATGWQSTSVGSREGGVELLLVPTVGAAGVAAGLMLPALSNARGQAQTITSVNNVKQLSLGARIYAGDHNDTYPPAATWGDAIMNAVPSPRAFKSPNDTGPNRSSYAYNAKVAGLSTGKVAPDTVMFFEASADWNTSGGIELLLPQPRSGGTYVVGLADGSVQQVSPARMRTLRWDP